ncbi:SRPBCC family protein [Sutcliffiella rhizosphaerae]|uniref:Activator of Hsp90 ATPase homologue 1/2-like C-terminal domain-containing protein n=1 Tax=Sutcliffiella rhizosphaerae TaxID=2880967 RepID=A0ABM8YNR6_9BACI|nr:SRPBCC domain-containing protein [Sutcliffiella rhizosphaerae]CAG9621616.1 putative protein YndB [Sutcliffiella rhizosphaerae]
MTNKILDSIKQTVTIDAPINKVWEKVASSKGIEEWFMPNNFEPEEGHEFTLQSPFGPSPCKVLEVDKPKKLSFSWDSEGWIITFLLNEGDGQTEFTLIHGGWKEADVILLKANEKSSVVRERMNGGWSQIVNRLKQAVENG